MPRLSPSQNARDLHERRSDFRERKQPRTQGVASDRAPAYETFVAKILSSPVSIGTNRWRYAWEEVVIKDDHLTAAISGSRKSRSTGTGAEFTYALNLCELCQAVSGTKVGPGVTIATLPSGFSAQPIEADTCVIMHALRRRSGRQLYAFSMPNAIDGTCPSYLTGGGGGAVEEGQI